MENEPVAFVVLRVAYLFFRANIITEYTDNS